MEDSRFAHIKVDPKFRHVSKKVRKVKIDKRFQSMFNDNKFKVKYTTDIRGRPVNQTSNEDLRRYYEISSDEESSYGSVSESEPSSGDDQETDKYANKPDADNVSDLKVKQESDGVLADPIKKKLHNLEIDYARGESKLLSDSSSDDEESEDDISGDEEVDHKWGELDNDAELTEKATHRLAACNMDWDRIRALDLMVLFNSFLPSGSVIKSVAIYPSEFGKIRMKDEELKGPTELVEGKIENEYNENEDGASYHMEKLRQYQLNRLKYYYAVISFDSAISANKIYTECDGMEYESSSIKIDLRFIPDDMEFDEEPKEFCDKIPDIEKYQPRFFTTTALQQAKVDLTWDETNPDRIEFSQKLSSGKIDNVSRADLQHYLAGSSCSEDSESEIEHKSKKGTDEDSEEHKAGTVDAYKDLLKEIEDKERSKREDDIKMEISWGIDLKEKTEKLIKDKMNRAEQKTPFEKYLDKKKEKRKEKRNKRKALNKVDSDSDIPSDIDMNDPFFKDEFDNSEYKKPMKNKKKEKGVEEIHEKDAQLELLVMNEDSQKHFNLKNIQDNENDQNLKKKHKNKKKATVDQVVDNEFQVNVQDERFSALFTSHHYNIDPTNPHYKKTQAMETIVKEKLKRRAKEIDDQHNVGISHKKLKGDVELNLLVKSVKRKTNEYLNR